MHPQSRCWQLLDYVLVRRRDRKDVLVIKAIRDADGWTDHRLVISKVRLRLQPQRRPQEPTMMTIPTTDNTFNEAPMCTITDTILPPPTSVPITATKTTYPTRITSVATSNYMPPATSNTTTALISSDKDSVLICPDCNRTFTSHIGLVSQLRIHRTETGELVPGAPTHSRDRRLQCPHCSHAFTHHMDLIGHMHIHESGVHRDASISCAPINTSPIPPRSSTTSRATADSAQPDLSCPYCHRICTSRIGLAGHLRIHRTETGEPVPTHQHKHTAPDSTVRTAHAPSHTAWAY
ncbi:unnamed protein product [Schistocephalus solidus]|uniref:C2H2-type domain-containing protein n=1 Tax=Schistocephalus solidus TaxID=70667 RepID=A0A183TD48_SCHSO|nr:unnamed protein product [Schistocephalus solidus]